MKREFKGEKIIFFPEKYKKINSMLEKLKKLR